MLDEHGSPGNRHDNCSVVDVKEVVSSSVVEVVDVSVVEVSDVVEAEIWIFVLDGIVGRMFMKVAGDGIVGNGAEANDSRDDW